MKSNWQTKKVYIVLAILIIVIASGFICPGYLSWLTFVVLTLTLGALVWYTLETKNIREQSVLQTELAAMPIMSLYIRNVRGCRDEEKRKSISEKYAITRQENNGIVPSPYYIALRNMGNGPAFNIEIESEKFKAEKYQTKFFAPNGDEHAVKINKKPNDKIRNLNDLKDEIFIIKCKSVFGKTYEYKYKIIDIEEKVVEFIKLKTCLVE